MITNNNININEKNEETHDIGMGIGIDCTGPCTVFHHQYFQMVDLLMHFVWQSMCGLNPHATPHAPPQYQAKTIKARETFKTTKKNNNASKEGHGAKQAFSNTSNQGWKKHANKKERKVQRPLSQQLQNPQMIKIDSVDWKT